MKELALMIIDSGSKLKEIPMLHNISKDETPKEFAYIGCNKAIRNSDIDKFISIIKEARFYIDMALEKVTVLKFRNGSVPYMRYSNKAWEYADNFHDYLSFILFEFKELEILEVLHPLLGCRDSEKFINKYWR